MDSYPHSALSPHNSIFSSHADAHRCVGFTGGALCVPAYPHLGLRPGIPLSCRTDPSFLLRFLLLSLLYHRLVLVPGEVRVAAVAVPRRVTVSGFPCTASPALTSEHPLPFQPPPEKRADTQIPTQHRHAMFGDISEQSQMCSEAPGAVITLSCHRVVTHTLKSH